MSKKVPKPHLSMWTSASFIVASMIGTGVFTSLGYQLLEINTIFPLLLLWLIGGIIAFCGALTYGELATTYPRSGGEYSLLSTILHPSLGFGAGLVSATIGFAAPGVLAAIALGSYLSIFFQNIEPSLFAILIISLIHIIHVKSIKLGTSFQNISTLIKIIFILVFIAFGLNIENPQSLTLLPVEGDMDVIFGAPFAVSLVWVSYAYTGWNTVIYVAGEVKNPIQNITKSMLVSTSIVMILYLLLNFTFLFTTPLMTLQGEVEVALISGIEIFGVNGGKVISLSISLLLLSTISSYIYIGPRVLAIMGEDYKELNFFNKKNIKGIPVNAFALQFFLSIIFILTSSFEQVLIYTSICLIIISSLTVFSLFFSRFKEKNLSRPYKAFGYPLTPLIYLMLNFWILFYSFIHSRFESFIGVCIFLFSIIIYFFFKKVEHNG
ncbi:amino acid permease [Candidatus Marinimicrobia bacterium]|nr:amino acid permease [Candidatus Neomarinimicrobiota bacterium]